MMTTEKKDLQIRIAERYLRKMTMALIASFYMMTMTN